MTAPISLHPQIEVSPLLPVRSPGEVLKQDFLVARNLSAARLARMTGIPVTTLRCIASGRRTNPITLDMALRFAAALGTSALYWLLLQARYDLDRVMRADGSAHKARRRHR